MMFSRLSSAIQKPFRSAFVHMLTFVLVSIPAFATAEVVTLTNPLQFDSISKFLEAILELVIVIGYPIIVLFIIYIGFQFVTASGNPEKLKEARKLFFWAMVGALIVLGAQVLSAAIEGTINEIQRAT